MSAGTLDSPLAIRWTTLAMAVVMLLVVGGWKRRPVVAIAALVAWVGGFEVAFRALDILRWHEWSAIVSWGWEAAALAGWVVVAHLLGVRPSLPWVAVTVVAFAVWWFSGFDYNLPQTAAGGGRPVRWGPEVENVAAKTAWAMAYLVGALRLHPNPLEVPAGS